MGAILLYIVRHGETDWNYEHRLQGRVDVPLNSTGFAQARALARHFEDRPLDRVISSPLTRAFATASMIAHTAGCPIEGSDDLREIDHGVWQGMTVGEIQTEYPDLWATWIAQPSKGRAPGAESLAEVCERADRVLQRLLNEHTCLVTHGVVSQVLVCRLMGRDPDAIFSVAQVNACINVFEIEDGRAVARDINFTAHLITGSLDAAHP